MNELQKGSWYFSRDGERIGPVNFSDLLLKARAGGLNPRLDVVWKEGMAEWKPAGEIEGLFERPPVPESFGTISATPEVDKNAVVPLSTVREQMRLVTNWPGARRRSFIFITLFFPVLWWLLVDRSQPLLKAQFGIDIAAKIKMAAVVVPAITLIYFTINRFRNLGMSSWWILAFVVPLLNLWASYRCYVCPAGYAFHRKLDAGGVILAIIYWLLLIGTLVVLAASAALSFKMIADPAIQQQIQEALDKARQMIPKQ